MAKDEKNLTAVAKGKQETATNIADQILANAPAKGAAGGETKTLSWSEEYLAKNGPQGATGGENQRVEPHGRDRDPFPPSSFAPDPTAPYGSGDNPMNAFHPVSEWNKALRESRAKGLYPSGSPIQAGNAPAPFGASGRNNRFAFVTPQGPDERAGVEQLQTRKQLLQLYASASPQTRAMIPPDLKLQLDMQISQANFPTTSPQTGTRVPNSAGYAGNAMGAEQMRVRQWAAQPATPPVIDRPSPIRGGGFFISPETATASRHFSS